MKAHSRNQGAWCAHIAHRSQHGTPVRILDNEWLPVELVVLSLKRNIQWSIIKTKKKNGRTFRCFQFAIRRIATRLICCFLCVSPAIQLCYYTVFAHRMEAIQNARLKWWHQPVSSTAIPWTLKKLPFGSPCGSKDSVTDHPVAVALCSAADWMCLIWNTNQMKYEFIKALQD